MASEEILSGQQDLLGWLLDWDNPSARHLALRDLFDGGEHDPAALEARRAIEDWRPVCEILSAMDPISFWGRSEWPFYGGPLSTHATLYLLARLGLTQMPQIVPACESLIEYGQLPCGGFSRDHTEQGLSLCISGTATYTLIQFGYAGDPNVDRALRYLMRRGVEPGGLGCRLADGTVCAWGVVKALSAFAALPPSERSRDRLQAARMMADVLLDWSFDFDGLDAQWLEFGFPTDYQSDLVELCDVLAQLELGADQRLDHLLDVLVDSCGPHDRWTKHFGTRALQVERRGEPSKWITIHALRALRRARRTGTEDMRTMLRDGLE
jgi:hypothetical protein